uniref:Secreted protein n=1 Tax=Steinernema glaseri TaxID=37863 RepID=A0A1I8AA82_9BILA
MAPSTKMVASAFTFAPLLLVLLLDSAAGQGNGDVAPFMGILSSRNIAQMAQLATDIAAHTLNNNRELLSKPGRPAVAPLTLDKSPSELISQGITNVMTPTLDKLAAPSKASPPAPKVPVKEGLPANFKPSPEGGENGLMKLANQFLRMANGQPLKTGADQLPNIRDFAPGAKNNFGIPQGEGCLPFVGEFMQIAYGNCVRNADQKTFDVWGQEITNALVGGRIDLLGASKLTCKMATEREMCGQLKRAVSECDILGSIQVSTQLQRSIKRCDEVTGIIDQNPMNVLNQVNGLLTGEVAQGFVQNFLG